MTSIIRVTQHSAPFQLFLIFSVFIYFVRPLSKLSNLYLSKLDVTTCTIRLSNGNIDFVMVISNNWAANAFLDAVPAFLNEATSIGRSVGWSVGRSVGRFVGPSKTGK